MSETVTHYRRKMGEVRVRCEKERRQRQRRVRGDCERNKCVRERSVKECVLWCWCLELLLILFLDFPPCGLPSCTAYWSKMKRSFKFCFYCLFYVRVCVCVCVCVCAFADKPRNV